jgi:hypothetical protein
MRENESIYGNTGGRIDVDLSKYNDKRPISHKHLDKPADVSLLSSASEGKHGSQNI